METKVKMIVLDLLDKPVAQMKEQFEATEALKEI